jgi:hypothetical protein
MEFTGGLLNRSAVMRLYAMLMFAVAMLGCDPSERSTEQSGAGGESTAGTTEIADGAAAAVFAARLANEKCHRLWRTEPFQPELHSAQFQGGRWHWGEYDPAGPGGFSAEVSFAPDGSNAEVRINFSTDAETEWEPPAEPEEDWGPFDEADDAME